MRNDVDVFPSWMKIKLNNLYGVLFFYQKAESSPEETQGLFIIHFPTKGIGIEW